MKFLNVDTLEQAREKLLFYGIPYLLRTKHIPLQNARGKTLAQDTIAPCDVPHFRRSTVDGYAVLAKDTAAARESIPTFLTQIGAVEMGALTSDVLHSGLCMQVPTGGMVPDGADAVVMVEYTESFGTDGVAVYQSVAAGENVIQIGEDIGRGGTLLHRGKRLIPQDIGALAAIGVTQVPVYDSPKVSIFSTGDELISPDASPKTGEIRDINSYTLAAIAQTHDFSVLHTEALPDMETILEAKLRQAMADSDIVFVSGGSSRGEKDKTADVIQTVATPGIFTQGLALKPGKPTILGYDASSETLLVGLPGHPAAALFVFELLFGWLQRALRETPEPPPIPGTLTCNISGGQGRLVCCLCTITWTEAGYAVDPIFSKSGHITGLVEADGYFLLGRDTEGLIQGQHVLVHLF